MKALLKIIVLVLMFVVVPMFNVFSQFPPPNPNDPPTNPQDIPIDGGLSFLFVAGLVYGAKKLYDNKNNEEFNEF